MNLSEQAIQAALKGNWETAIKLNLALLQENLQDPELICRLAHAYEQNGETENAEIYYRAVLKLDKTHPIALKNFRRLTQFKKTGKVSQEKKKIFKKISFLEQTGKTKLVELTNLATAAVLLSLEPGEPLELCPKNHTIYVRKNNSVYVGALPDDLAHRLIFLLRAGNRYEVFAKSVNRKNFVVFICETYSSPKAKKYTSFLPCGCPISFLKTETEDEEKEEGEEEEETSDNLSVSI